MSRASTQVDSLKNDASVGVINKFQREDVVIELMYLHIASEMFVCPFAGNLLSTKINGIFISSLT